MVYWEKYAEDGTGFPVTIKNLGKVLGEAGWHRPHHFFQEVAHDLAREGIIRVTNGRDGQPFETYL